MVAATKEENERRAAAAKARALAARQQVEQSIGDDVVLDQTQLAAVWGVSINTMREMLLAQDAPPLIEINKRKKGLTVAQNREWQQRRIAAAAAKRVQ
jgi:hypothetical protein